MKPEPSDLLIIGAGPGGYRAAAYAAQNGLSVTVVEASEVGGTCLNCGCIPTKSLCHDAEVGNTDFCAIMARKDEVVAQLRSGVETLLSAPGITLVRGKAEFVPQPSTPAVQVTAPSGDVSLYTARDIIIATGSRAKMPPITGIDLPQVVTSTELLSIDHVPSRLCIVGAGVIGMEFASCFQSFGSEVTVIEFLKECLPTMDGDIAKRLRKSLEKRGITFHLQSGVEEIKTINTIEAPSEAVGGANTPGPVRVSFTKKGKAMDVEADIVLIATGRAANTEGLNLEAAGIATDRRGIVVDPNTFEAAPHIYAIGDVNGRQMLAHAATYQGLHVVNRILGKPDNIFLDIMPAAVFTHPEAASVGPTEEQLKEAATQANTAPDGSVVGNTFTVHKAFYRANGKALATNASEGLVKVFTDADDRIIAAHILGAHAADMVQEIAALMNCNVTLAQLRDMVHIHPTLGEMLTEVN